MFITLVFRELLVYLYHNQPKLIIMYPFKTIQKPVVVIEGLPQTQVEETDNSPVEELFT